jgi:hypothetical protein
MHLIEVITADLANAFIRVNVELNKDNPAYIRPLDKDVQDVFDKKKSKTFRYGTAIRWILKDEKGSLIGRVAAFVNKKYKNKGDNLPVGGLGFFECINDQQAANLLFNAVKNWLLEQGIQAMDGPINFGERDRWWGLVVHGFQPPLYCMNYNPPYYQQMFETYGFKLFYDQICFGKDPKKKLSPKVLDRHAPFEKDSSFTLRNIEINNFEKYAHDFALVYNAAWAGHGGLKEMKKEQVLLMFNKMKPVMDVHIIWFAYHHEDPIAIFVNLPDLNQWFKYLNGKFDIFHKLKFLWIKKTKKCSKFTGVVFGIVPEFQGKGIDAFIVGEAYKSVVDMDYTEYEMQWIGDFNPKMINVAESMGDVHRSRRLITYRYLFDRNKEYKRHPIL